MYNVFCYTLKHYAYTDDGISFKPEGIILSILDPGDTTLCTASELNAFGRNYSYNIIVNKNLLIDKIFSGLCHRLPISVT